MKTSTHHTWLALAGLALISGTVVTVDAETEWRRSHRGHVTWGNDNLPPERDIHDTIPHRENGKKGILKFHWTKNGAKHPEYQEYSETNNSLYADRKRRFVQPNDPTITDWWQRVGHEGKGNSEVFTGNLTRDAGRGGDWTFAPLMDLEGEHWSIPDLLPADDDATIYTAVNFGMYMDSNPFGFLDGAWSIGDTIDELNVSVVDGRISGLEGILFATTPFVFDAASEIGWVPVGGASTLLNSDDYQAGRSGTIEIGGAHAGTPTPGTLSCIGIASLLAFRRRR